MSTKVFYRYNTSRIDNELYNPDYEQSIPPIPPVVDNFLQEDGFFFLQEDGFRFLEE